jgi:hypothetical protein
MSDSNRHRLAERRQAQEDAIRWGAELVTRFCAALTPGECAQILTQLDLPHTLEEDAALALYRAQAQLSSEFIQRHLPRGRRADDPYSPWHRLMGQAQARHDELLYFALYRAQATPEQWARDTGELASSLVDPQSLCSELERRHPNRWRADIGPQLAQLALQRGAHLLPYVLQRAPDVWSAGRRNGYQQLVELSERQGWSELWAALLRSCASAAEYDRAVMALLADRDSEESSVRQRLLLLAGIGPAAAASARLLPLRDATLVALYERFPHLARGPFRRHLEPSPVRPLSGLLQSAIEHRDEDLIDHLSARLAVRAERSGAERLLQTAALAESHLQKVCAEAGTLERRACAILLRVRRRTIRNQRDLLRRNSLARLLFERAGEACLGTEAAAAALLQAEDDQVCAVAVHAVTSDDPRALPLARQNLDRLLAAIDRPLPRVVARQAVRALDRAAGEPGSVERILTWARAALDRRSSSSPQQELVELVARQLSLHPALRGEREAPLIYRITAA